MKFKHAPSPWKITVFNENSSGYKTCEIRASDGTLILDDGSCYGEYEKSTPYDANALLIASAPDMLNLLKSVARCDFEDSEDKQQFIYVIEKATGLTIDEVLK